MKLLSIFLRLSDEIKKRRYKSSTEKVYLYRGTNCYRTSFKGHNTVFKGAECIECDLGEYSYVQQNTFLLRTRVGKFCSIADHVRTGFGNHPIQMVSTWPGFYYDTTPELKYTFHKGASVIDVFRTVGGGKFLVEIGNDVWIGSHVLIMDGVKIGDGAVIAAGAVVTKDVEPYAIYGGVPAKLLKYRFQQEIIDSLLELKWWDRDPEWIMNNFQKFKNTNEFVKANI